MYALADNGLGYVTYELMHRFYFKNQQWPSSPNAMVSDLRRQVAMVENEKGCVLKFQISMYDIVCNAAWVAPDIEERVRLLLEVFSPGWTFIYLHRRDIDSAVVSTAFSRVTDRWQATDNGKPVTIDDYDESLIAQYRSWYEGCLRDIDRFFKFAPGYRVAYEDLVYDPGFLEEALGVDLSRIRNKTDHMPDPVKQQWVERYKISRA